MSLNLNIGMKELMINNDPQRVIRWNPADPEFVKRFDELAAYVGSLHDKLHGLPDICTEGEFERYWDRKYKNMPRGEG